MLGFSNSKEDKHRELVDRIRSCEECGLHRKRSGMPVPGVGPLRADVVFVGEAPGLQEEQQGYPFVVTAPAGSVFTEAVKQGLGFGREHCFIMNTVCCRPTSLDPHRQNDHPEVENAIACSNHFEEQIEIIDPKVIVALGGVASNRITGEDAKPGQYRNRLWWYYHWPVVCTWHPSYAARQGGVASSVFTQIVDDLRIAGRIRAIDPLNKDFEDFKEACESV